MKLKLLLIPIIFLLTICLASAENELLIKDFTLADSNTASATFVTVDSSQSFTVNKTIDAHFIVSFVGELVDIGAPFGTRAEVGWRLLLDGTQIDNKFVSLDIDDPSRFLGITMIGFKEDISVGSHTLELQHKTSEESITTRDISFMINMNTLVNTTLSNPNSFDIPVTNLSALPSLKIFESALFNVSETSDLILVANVNVTRIGGSIEEFEHFYQINDQQTQVFVNTVAIGAEGATIRNAGDTFVFENIPAGQHNVSLFGTSNPPLNVDGKILLTQRTTDGSKINLNKTIVETNQVTTLGTFFNITSLQLNVADNSDILAMSSGSFNRALGQDVSRGVGTIRFLLEDGTTSVIREGELRIANNPQNLFLTHIFEDLTAGSHNVTLQQKAELSNMTFNNFTFTLIEVNDYDTNIQLPVVPAPPAFEGEISSIIDSLEFDTGNGMTPTSIRVGDSAEGQIYGVFYEGALGDGFVKTFEVTDGGTINSVIDTFEFDTVAGTTPHAVSVNGTIYAVFYQGAGTDGFVKTIQILNNGSIIGAVDVLEFDVSNGVTPTAIKFKENIFLVAYEQLTQQGFLKSINISNDGAINGEIDSFIYNDTQALNPDMISISENVIAIAYENDVSAFGGLVETIQINDDGTISNSIDSEVIDATLADNPSIIKIDNQINYAVAYTDVGTVGSIKTFNITPDGQILGFLDSFAFESGDAVNADAVKIRNNLMAAVYQDAASLGKIFTVSTLANGSINKTIIDNATYEPTQSIYQEIINVIDELFLITYEGVGNDGFLTTINISFTPPPIVLAPPQAILIKEIIFPNSTTTSSTFQTVGTATVNLTKQSDILAVVSFQARREGGIGEDNYTWRFLIDGIAGEENITRSLSVGDIGSVVFSNDRDDLAIGEHNITFQHLSTDGTLFTENINLVANLNLLENNSNVNHLGIDFDTGFASTSYTEVMSGDMNVTEAGDMMMIFTISVGISTGVNTVEFIIEFDNENSSSFKRRMESSTDIGSIGYVWMYENILTGTKNWKVWGRNTDAVTTTIIGHLDFSEMVNDNVPTTMAHFTNESTRISTSNTFIQVANLSMPTVRNNFVYVVSGFTTNIENQAAVRNVSYFLRGDNVDSPILSRAMSNADDIGNLFIQKIFNDSATTHNVSLFVSSELSGGEILVISNVSMFAMEVIDFESVITLPFIDTIPPSITLINPSNNTATNVIPLNITFSATDDSGNEIICNLENSTTTFDSGTFSQSTNSNLTLAKGVIVLDQSFPNLELTCFDNTDLNNSATLNLNYTLDTVPPIIFTLSPANNSIFNPEIVSSINIKANCTDAPVFRFNITITNTSDIVSSFESFTVVDNFIVIDETLDISTLGQGAYTQTHTCADTHTLKEIKDYQIKKDKGNNKLEWDTGKNKFGIRYDESNPVNLLNFKTTKQKDRYLFNFNTNKSEGEKSTYIFVIENTQSIYYIKDSEYKAHFITGDNWIDFEFNDPDAVYDIYMNVDDKYVVEITTTKADLTFYSIGDLNINTVTTSFIISSTIQITDDTFSLTSCPIDSLTKTLIFMFIIVLSFVVMAMAFVIKNGLVGSIGAVLLIILSAYLYACLIAVGLVITALGIYMLVFFIFKGSNNML